MSQPMDLSELRLQVAKYMNGDTLKRCSTVCRAWHWDFQPLVWHYFNAVHPATSDHEEYLDGVRRNARWIRHLGCFMRYTVYSALPALYNLLVAECRSLVSLQMQVDEATQLYRFISLLRQNKTTLRQVKVRFKLCDWPSSKDLDLSQALQSLSSLQELRIFNTSLPVSDIQALLTANPSVTSILLKCYSPLETVSKGVSSFEYRNTHQKPMAPSSDLPVLHLKTFEMEGQCYEPALVTLLSRCPSLEHLHMGALGDNVREGMCQLFQRRHWPQLASLGLESSSTLPYSLPRMVDAIRCYPLSTICLWYPDSAHVRHIVENHQQTLEVLDISIRDGEEGSIGFILSQCSRLKRLRFMNAEDGIEARLTIGQPWVCTQLEELRVPLVLDSECQEDMLLSIGSEEKDEVAPGREEYQQAMIVVMKRLGQLTKLKRMDLLLGHFIFGSLASMPWSLSNGLTHLAHLSKLTSLDFGRNQMLPFGVPELQFLKQHWVSLTSLISSGMDPAASQWLKVHWPALKVK